MNNVTAFPPLPMPPVVHRFTIGEHNDIVGGTASISPSWGAIIDQMDTGEDYTSIGYANGAGASLHMAENTYSIGFDVARRVVLADVRVWEDLGTFATVAEAVDAMKVHASHVRY